MIAVVFWWWVFAQLQAPTWLWVLLIGSCFVKLIISGYELYQEFNS